MGLLDLIHKLPSVNEMTGGVGEQLAKYYAKIMTDTLVLHDVLIDGAEGYTSQIDLLMIGNKGIYVVEVKTYGDAKVYGDGTKTKWVYYKNGKRYEIYSPLKQNQNHIKYLKKFLCSLGEVPCFSVLTILCDDFKVSNINRSEDITTVVCNSLPAMQRAIEKIAEGKPVVLDDIQKKAIFDYIMENQHIGKEAHKVHKENVIAYQNIIAKMEDEKICPYCKTPLLLRKGKYGEFYGCSNYPRCKYTLS